MLDPEGSFAKSAADNGYDDVDAYLQLNFGKGVTTEIYHDYLLTYYTAVNYYKNVLYGESANALTDAEVEAYYDENAQSYIDQGVTKVNNVSVRHILIQPEGEKDSDGNYSDEAKAAAKAEAERILALWQADPTEDNFKTLALEYNQDPGSKDNGGLYEDFQPGKMVTEFNDWCFDESRQPGDCEIVETTHGYHIIYFIGQTETRAWFDTAKEDMASAAAGEKITELKTKYPVEFNFNNVVIYDLLSASVSAS